MAKELEQIGTLDLYTCHCTLNCTLNCTLGHFVSVQTPSLALSLTEILAEGICTFTK